MATSLTGGLNASRIPSLCTISNTFALGRGICLCIGSHLSKCFILHCPSCLWRAVPRLWSDSGCDCLVPPIFTGIIPVESRAVVRGCCFHRDTDRSWQNTKENYSGLSCGMGRNICHRNPPDHNDYSVPQYTIYSCLVLTPPPLVDLQELYHGTDLLPKMLEKHPTERLCRVGHLGLHLLLPHWPPGLT